MLHTTMTIAYVEDMPTSCAFYEQFLGAAPLQKLEAFALFPLPGGGKLGLWRRDVVTPAPEPDRTGELTFLTADPDALHAAWLAAGYTTVQAPFDSGFGRNVVMEGPDGERLRGLRLNPVG